jgi:hypothetical protein
LHLWYTKYRNQIEFPYHICRLHRTYFALRLCSLRVAITFSSCLLSSQHPSTETIPSSLLTDVTGFVALDPSSNTIVISFRGSHSIRNFLTDLDFTAIPTDLCKPVGQTCTAHKGFWTSWTEARNTVLGAVKNTIAQNPNYRIAVTGHSLGGAIAAICATELRNAGYKNVALFTFGSPRLAGTQLSSYITNQGASADQGGNYRVTHWNDLVPRLPPVSMSFVHISPEYYIAQPNQKNVAMADVKIYQGAIPTGGNGVWLITDILAHLWYFNDVAACRDKSIEFKRDLLEDWEGAMSKMVERGIELA